MATTRVLAGYDRILGENWALGARGGLVVRGGGPRPDGEYAPAFLPYHGELRVAYAFGEAPFRSEGFRFSLFLGGGVAQVDTATRVLVEEDTSKPPPVSQGDNPLLQTLTVYEKSGTGFMGGGAGAAFVMGPSSSLFFNLKLMRLFPSEGFVIAPELGCEYGF